MVTTLFLLLVLQLPPAPTQYVTDNAHVLPADRAVALEKKLHDFDKATTNQVIVYIDRRLPAGATLEETATAAFNTWGVGQKEKNNGVVLFLFTEDRKYRIEVGYGLESALTNERSKDITARMKPFLRKEDYAGAVELGVDEILAATRPVSRSTPAPVSSPPPAAPAPSEWSAGSIAFVVTVIVIGGGFALLIILGIGMFRALDRWPSAPPSAPKTPSLLQSGSWGIDSSSSGSSSSNSGFSGGGGQSSGGGGASDSW